MEETPENARLFSGQQISQDLLNKIAPSGMPPHKLTLKEGAPVMLLRKHAWCLWTGQWHQDADTQDPLACHRS